eukprot:CAMPEP_0119146174 /NCGR_PEP_ID=MMETSP1310-20130426/38508_1 /TAXON_ID=464262 /ORGANISM="Genus nov. species nov., Strain RCC2339" /LENGTH=167 /DNA_ID=CAMNT_0007138043 /DNA_START=104 /DNA_END=607 /DNA_ORIENTATION=+
MYVKEFIENVSWEEWEDRVHPGSQLEREHLPGPRPGDLTDNTLRRSRWAEQFVFEKLAAAASAIPGGGQKIVWVNEMEESFQPFDITIQKEGEDTPNLYIEVKSTIEEEKSPSFPISEAELDFARIMAERYFVYRLSGLQGSQLKVVQLANVVNLLQNGAATLFLQL